LRVVPGGGQRAAALWSADGRHWPKAPTLLPTSASGSGSPAISNAVTLTVGDQGMIAAGIGGSPGSALWWRSADGQHWQALQGFPPLGSTNCGGASCSVEPNGTLFGDGHRLVALRTGADGVGWVSTDGERWAALSFSGDVPDVQATQATLLPGGSCSRTARPPGSARPTGGEGRIHRLRRLAHHAGTSRSWSSNRRRR
jgi:hypothetical protein